jgi:CPA2 family monovalent cation:H+ antiporter-2
VPGTLELTLILLLVAVLAVSLFKRLRLPPMLGYLAAGVIVGPFAGGIVPDTPETRYLAEFGIVFLMFSIGLEFSLSKLHAMRRVVFGLGLAQVGVTIISTMLLGWLVNLYTGVSYKALFVLAGALAMSSTAIVVKMMAERGELETVHGRLVLGILLFQDLAVVPLLIIIPALADKPADMTWELGMALVKASMVLVLMLVFGQRLMIKWMNFVARGKSQELFVLNVLLLTLGLAWMTEEAGLSLALGAFLAGVLIAETEYRHQVEEDIKAFRDVLLGLFFITTGMLLNPAVVIKNWYWVLLLSTVPVVFKAGLITGLAMVFRAEKGPALRTGLYLAQAGEFAFVMFAAAAPLNLMPTEWLQTISAAMLLSMMIAPALIQNADRIVLRLSRDEWLAQSFALHQIAQRTLNTERHVLICGYGRSGQHLGRLLSNEGVRYVALDLDPERVREAAVAGESVVFGDAGRREILVAAGVARAACVVVSFAQLKSTERVLATLKQLSLSVPVVVRTHDERDIEPLLAAGATEVVSEIYEGSLMLGSQALILMGIPLSRVVRQIRSIRESRYTLFKGVFRGADDEADTPEAQWVRLHSVELTPGASAVGRSLGQLHLRELEVSVTAIRRRGIRGDDPSDDILLEVGDILVLKGQPEPLARAENLLLAG